MYSKLNNDFEHGIGKIRWFARLLAERVRIEMMVFRLTCRTEELRKKRDALFRNIGEEVYRMRKNDKSVHSNQQIAEALKELDALEPKLRETEEKVADITRATM